MGRKSSRAKPDNSPKRGGRATTGRKPQPVRMLGRCLVLDRTLHPSMAAAAGASTRLLDDDIEFHDRSLLDLPDDWFECLRETSFGSFTLGDLLQMAAASEPRQEREGIPCELPLTHLPPGRE